MTSSFQSQYTAIEIDSLLNDLDITPSAVDTICTDDEQSDVSTEYYDEEDLANEDYSLSTMNTPTLNNTTDIKYHQPLENESFDEKIDDNISNIPQKTAYIDMQGTNISNNTQNIDNANEQQIQNRHKMFQSMRKNTLRIFDGNANDWESTKCEDCIEWCDQWIIDPEKPFRVAWDVIVSILLIYTCIEVPLAIAFDLQSSINDGYGIAGLIVDLLLCVDILLNFRTAYFIHVTAAVVNEMDSDSSENTSENGKRLKIFNSLKIVMKYLRTWFIIDIVSSFPIEYMMTGGNTAVFTYIKTLRFTRLIRLLKLLRFLKTARFFQKFLKGKSSSTVIYTLQFIKILSLMIYISHIFGCLWYWIGSEQVQFCSSVIDVYEYTFGDEIGNAYYKYLFDTNSTSIYFTNDGEMVDFEKYSLQMRVYPLQATEDYVVTFDGGFAVGNSWLIKGDFLQYPTVNLYVASVYWAVTTLFTTGYGDIVPQNKEEMITASVVILMGTMYFMYLIAMLSTMFTHSLQQKLDYAMKQRRREQIVKKKKQMEQMLEMKMEEEKKRVRREFRKREQLKKQKRAAIRAEKLKKRKRLGGEISNESSTYEEKSKRDVTNDQVNSAMRRLGYANAKEFVTRSKTMQIFGVKSNPFPFKKMSSVGEKEKSSKLNLFKHIRSKSRHLWKKNKNASSKKRNKDLSVEETVESDNEGIPTTLLTTAKSVELFSVRNHIPKKLAMNKKKIISSKIVFNTVKILENERVNNQKWLKKKDSLLKISDEYLSMSSIPSTHETNELVNNSKLIRSKSIKKPAVRISAHKSTKTHDSLYFHPENGSEPTSDSAVTCNRTLKKRHRIKRSSSFSNVCEHKSNDNSSEFKFADDIISAFEDQQPVPKKYRKLKSSTPTLDIRKLNFKEKRKKRLSQNMLILSPKSTMSPIVSDFLMESKTRLTNIGKEDVDEIGCEIETNFPFEYREKIVTKKDGIGDIPSMNDGACTEIYVDDDRDEVFAVEHGIKEVMDIIDNTSTDLNYQQFQTQLDSDLNLDLEETNNDCTQKFSTDV